MPKAVELKVRVENRPGILGEVASALGEKKVNLRGAHAWAEGAEGYIRLVADKPAAARKALAARGWNADERNVLELVLPDRPGALGAAAAKLGRAGVNVEYMYVGTAKGARKVSVFFGVPDVAAAQKAAR
jgi:hypothetical protein